MEHGTLDTPVEYYCALAHAQAEYLGLLGPGEKAWEILNWRERTNTFSGLAPLERVCFNADGCRPDG
jgi:hypothetical protein